MVFTLSLLRKTVITLVILTLTYLVLTGFSVLTSKEMKESDNSKFLALAESLLRAQNKSEEGPLNFNMEVAFTSQAPYQIWDHLHQEACEEAALIMANAWVNNTGSLRPEIVESQIRQLVSWEIANFSYFEDTTAEETARLAREFYDLKVNLIVNPTIKQIKKEIKKGHLVVMGMAGRELDNPHFRTPGPVYHMLVLKGYDEHGFFVNDPGTKYGKNLYYPNNIIMKAAHDWNGSADGLYGSNPTALIFTKSR